PELARLDATVITLAAGEDVTVLARLQSDSSLQLKPKLYFDTGYVVAERQTGILDGIFFGGLLTLAFCALMLALFTRSLRFGLLAGVSLATVLYEASMRGYAKLYLWPEASEWAQRSTKVFGYLSLALFLVFVLRMARRENI